MKCKCPFLCCFGSEITCVYLDEYHNCDGVDVNPGNSDAWCMSIIEKSIKIQNMNNFSLSQSEYATYNNWMTQHNQTCKYNYKNSGKIASAIGGRITFLFTPNSLGMCVEVKCACGEKIDVTDTSGW